MADPCDIVEDAVAAKAALPRAIVKPRDPLEATGRLASAATSVLTALFLSSGAAGDEVQDARGALFVSSGVIGSSVPVQAVATSSLVIDRAFAHGSLRSMHADLAAALGTLADAVIQNDVADLAADQAELGSSVIATLVAVELVKASMTGRSSLLRLVYEGLVTAGGVAGSASVGFVDATSMLSAGGVASASADDALQAMDRASVAAQAGAITLDQLTALELVDTDAWGHGNVMDTAAGMTWWTAATDTLGMSRYRMPELQSMAVVAGDLMAVGASGVFVRGGDSDDGALIDAYVRTGLQDFGNDHLKRLDHLYIGYTSGSGMRVDVGETSTGAETTYSYTMPPRAATAPTQGRVRLGRGLRSLYYRFTLRNADGKPLRITRAGVDVNETGRKV